MANSSPSNNAINFLTNFASILGIIGIFLYFTGWIYRWAYFGFFQLELNKIELPIRSYLFVPIQVFFGNPFSFSFLRTLIIVALTAIAIILTITFYHFCKYHYSHYVRNLSGLNNVIYWRYLRHVISFSYLSFIKDLIIIFWLLTGLFWLGRIQGWEDARRDAVNQTSTLPVFTYVFPEKQLLLGRKVDNITSDISEKGYKIIGDFDLLQSLQGIETNDKEKQRVWRLLLNQKNWIYCFPALEKDADKKEAPPVLAIKEDKEGQFIILSPNVPIKDSLKEKN